MQDDDVTRMRVALARIARLVDRQVAGDGLTRTQLSVLGTMAREKSLGIGELADIEGLNPTMLSRMVGKLETAGLLRRTPGADDRRAVVVEITAAGSRLHTRLRRERGKLFADRLADLPTGEVDTLLHAIPALESLAVAMRRTEAPPAGIERARTGAGR